MAWQQLTFDTDSSAADKLADVLNETGAVSVTFEDSADQPLLELPPGATVLWKHTRVIGLFEEDADIVAVLDALRSALPSLPPHQLTALEDQDWERAWMKDFHPLRFGRRLWVCPRWLTPPDPEGVNIMLDPGLAFGTGTHPTTALCLEWLDGHDLNNLDVIDYGCGSGILAIAAAKLGARHVWAVDYDPQALEATQQNAAENGVARLITTGSPEQLSLLSAHVLLANILAQPLIQLASRFAEIIQSGGHVVLSGILSEQAQEVLKAYQDGFIMEEPVEREGWVRLAGRRKH